jgi:REP element-mobilizing transposase RayT
VPQSLSNILLHIVFSTKNRRDFISPSIEKELYAYMAKIFQNKSCQTLIIGGTANHIHSLCRLDRTVAVADLVQEVKQGSSKWIKTKGEEFSNFSWQAGYGAFSIGESNVAQLFRYISNQAEHHQKVSFKDEFRAILKKYNVEYDEKYVWD